MKCLKILTIILFSCLIMPYNLVLAEVSDNSEKVRDFVNNIGNKTLNIIQNTNSAPKEKEEVLRQLFVNTVDIKWIGDFVLGRYLTKFTPDQLTEYHATYKQYLINSYVPKFKQYTQESFKITNISKRSNNEYKVDTLIARPNNQFIAVSYMIRTDSNHIKVFDIIAEGVSLILTTRADFNSIIANNNSQIGPFIKQLKSKVESE